MSGPVRVPVTAQEMHDALMDAVVRYSTANQCCGAARTIVEIGSADQAAQVLDRQIQHLAAALRDKLASHQVNERLPGFWGITTLRRIEQGAIAPTAEFLLMWTEALGRPLTLATSSAEEGEAAR